MVRHSRNSKLNQQIDDNLRRVYDDAAREPVPERFTKLLEQLRQQEQKPCAPESDTSPEDDVQ